jgi:hypothetical protein
MESANISVLRRPDVLVAGTASSEPRTLRVTATYTLSESGRKASLLAGGNGRAEQAIQLDIPGNRLHLVTVDAEGHATLKLRPRYGTKPDGRVSRIDASPVYDAPPSIEELLLTAAKNHELERAYVTQGSRRERKRESQRELRERLAEEFLKSPEQRAATHPAPSKTRCYLVTDAGRILFDAERDEPPARDVPAEAHRRFRADERATRERNLQEHARRIALHEEKKRFIAEWIASKGSRDQQERHTAGLLPLNEAIDAIADNAFAPFGDWPRYAYNGAQVLQVQLRRRAEYQNAVVADRDLAVTDANATEATPAQWQAVQRARALVPNATVTLRSHRLTWKADPTAPAVTLHGLLVTQSVGPVTVRREFEIPASTQSDIAKSADRTPQNG